MDTVKVGIREFRDKLATYVMNTETPLAITRHGDTVGLYIPVRRKRTEAERSVFAEFAHRWQKELEAASVDEDDVVAKFQRSRKSERVGRNG